MLTLCWRECELKVEKTNGAFRLYTCRYELENWNFFTRYSARPLSE